MRTFHAFQQTTTLFTKYAFRPTQQRFSSALHRPLILRRSPLLDILSRSPRRACNQRLLTRRFASSKPTYNPTPNLNSPEPSLSLSQRLRKLSREYGWSALGVYLLLSALDFPFCFIAVRWLGTDRIGHWEHVAVEWIKRASPIQIQLPPWMKTRSAEVAGTGVQVDSYRVVDPQGNEVGMPGYDHGVKEAEQRNKSENASKYLRRNIPT